MRTLIAICCRSSDQATPCGVAPVLPTGSTLVSPLNGRTRTTPLGRLTSRVPDNPAAMAGGCSAGPRLHTRNSPPIASRLHTLSVLRGYCPRLAQCAANEHAHHLALVLGAAIDVGDRVAVGSGQLRGGVDRIGFGWQAPAPQRVF